MMTRIDMSEYQEKFSVSRLVGAPPGYVGYEEGGQLTEAVRRKPYSVVLFDEIEKAHPDVFNILLQVLDDGRLTDNKGRTVNFRNTIIIMTPNLGSQYIQSRFEELAGKSGREYENAISETRNHVMDMLKKTIRPEFLNRIDEIIMFRPLEKEQIRQIVRLQLKGISDLLKQQDVSMNVSESAVDLLASAGFDPEFGARPVKRALQRLLLNDLSKNLLSGKIDRTKPIHVDAANGSLVFTLTSKHRFGQTKEHLFMLKNRTGKNACAVFVFSGVLELRKKLVACFLKLVARILKSEPLIALC